jgi:hypothetical protein
LKTKYTREISVSYPSFIGIGAPRCGTTWLHEVLSDHHNIWLPPLKELHYFDVLDPSVNRSSFRFKQHFKSRLKHDLAQTFFNFIPFFFQGYKSRIKGDVKWDINYFSGIANDKWYKNLFKKAHDAYKITGEITPSYSLLSDRYINKILSINPDMKFIYLLRDPIDRSWSHAVKVLCRDKGRRIDSIPEEKFINFYYSKENAECCNYAKNIRRYLKQINNKNLYIDFFDNINTNPSIMINKIYSFVGVEQTADKQKRLLNTPVNVASRGYNISENHKQILANMHYDSLRDLYDIVGGEVVSSWQNRAKQLMQK